MVKSGGGRLGFVVQDLTPELAEAFGVARKKGVVVARVEAKSPAQKAGVKVGDVIIAVNGREVESSTQVRNEIGLLRVGSKVKIEVLRDGKTHQLTASVGKHTTYTVSGKSLNEKLAGAKLSEVQEDPSRRAAAGIEVVEARGRAAAAGLRKGDIIISVNRTRVKTIQDMKSAIKKNPDALLLNIQREARGLFILIR